MRSLSFHPVQVLDTRSNDTISISEVNELPSASGGRSVDSLADLKKQIAALKVANMAYTFLYRGQTKDWQTDKNESSLFPSALRHYLATGESKVIVKGMHEPIEAYTGALNAMQTVLPGMLEKHYPESNRRSNVTGIEFLAIVQHYEILPTLLLDVTSNLQVAYSFAYNQGNPTYLYVIAIPNFYEPISVNVESGVLLADLTKVCPPTALRPHFQDGYVIAPYPGLHDEWEKLTGQSPIQKMKMSSWNFSNIVIAKFILSSAFWSDPDVSVLSHSSMYPNSDDPVFDLANSLRATLGIPAQE